VKIHAAYCTADLNLKRWHLQLKEFFTFLPLIGHASHTSRGPMSFHPDIYAMGIINQNCKGIWRLLHKEYTTEEKVSQDYQFLFPLNVLISPLWPKSLRHELAVHGPSWEKCWWRTENELTCSNIMTFRNHIVIIFCVYNLKTTLSILTYIGWQYM
jgi:hypothetical protein